MNNTDNIDIKVIDLHDYAFVICVSMDGEVTIRGSIERDDVIRALEDLVAAMKQQS